MAATPQKRRWAALQAAALAGLIAITWHAAVCDDPLPASTPATQDAPAGDDDDVAFWLKQAGRPSSQPSSQPVGDTAPAANDDESLPGVIELSDGRLLAGMLRTTKERAWLVFVESEKRWRSIPFITVLSITAAVDEEAMEQEWRWKEMGVPERVYTGREYPTRRLQWKFHLIDDSTITGTVKGQPLHLRLGQTALPPFVLHERSKGEPGQKMSDLIYVKRVLVSRKMMDLVVKGQTPATRPAVE